MKREKSIDFFKTLLVIGMITAHCIQFLGNMDTKIQYIISLFVNLITFSGFMFCFGYASNIAYFKKEKQDVFKKLIKNIFNILIVFYISGIGYSLLISNDLSLTKIVKILILWTIPGYSEFLAGFCVLNLMILLLFDKIKQILSNKKIFLTVLIISLVCTFIPYKFIFINQIGLFIGSEKFSCYPVLQYLGYFLIGAYFQQNTIKYNLKYLIVSTIGTSIFATYTLINNSVPKRFPPSFYWIVGSSLLLYVYYLICIYITNKFDVKQFVYFIGKNTLSFLLCSNIILFTLKHLLFNTHLNLLAIITLNIIVILITYIIIFIYKSTLKNMIKRNNRILKNTIQ